jgi:peptide subunit release factor 1 (eRF1)
MRTSLSPSDRDALVQQFQALEEQAPFRLLTPHEMVTLGQLEASDAPIVSAYLDLGPDARRDRAWATVLKSNARQRLERIDDRRQARFVEAELARIERSLSHKLPDLGRSVAVFSSEPLGLWHEVVLPVPLPNRFEVGERPYMRPLFRVLDEHDRFLLVVLDDKRARLFISQLGSIVEIADLIEEGPSLTHGGGWAQMRLQRQHDAHVLWHAGAVAHASALALEQFGARWMLVAGTPDVLVDFRNQISPPAAARMAGEFKVNTTVPASQVASAAAPLQRQVEAREESATVDRLSHAPPGGKAAWGLVDTLAALNDGRVLSLVVLDDFRSPGAVCGDTGRLYADAEGLCPDCGESLTPLPDVVDIALERAHRLGARLELVRSADARAQLAARAPIAAGLRY